jgi:hypothetical protein
MPSAWHHRSVPGWNRPIWWYRVLSPRAPAIAQRLVITERSVAKHTASIFLRLGMHAEGGTVPE